MDAPERVIEDLIIPFQRRKKPGDVEIDLIGIDSETIDGKAILLCDSDGYFMFPKSFSDCISFLTSKRYRSKKGVFWNLQYDFQAIIKWLPEKLLQLLYKKQEINFIGFKIKYIPRKMFLIQKGHKSYVYYDLCQFYDSSLQTASEKWLHDKKEDFDCIDIKYEDLNDEAYRSKLSSYCIKDAVLCYKLGRFLLDKFKTFGLYPRNLLSKAAVAETHFRKTCNIPTINKIEDDVIRLAYHSYRGGWFEVFQRGYFEQCYEYDLNSAYPYNIANLIDIDRGTWVVDKQYGKEAYYGFINATVNIHKSPSPIPYIHPKGFLVFPTGQFTTTITKQEFDLIESKLGNIVEIHEACWFYPDKLVYPFRKEVERLYKERKKAEGIFEYIIKIILNSIYGKTIQKHWDYKRQAYVTGGLFNPMYASLITSQTRCKIYESLPKYEDLISIATDSIVSCRKLDIPESKEMGQWKLEMEGEGIFVGSGIYNLFNKEKTKKKNRCFKSRNTLLDLFQQGLDQKKFMMTNKRPLSLGDIIQKTCLYSYKDLNVFVEDNKSLDINFDRKRLWEDEFKDAQDLLSRNLFSLPLSVDLIERAKYLRSLSPSSSSLSPFETKISEAGGLKPYLNGYNPDEIRQVSPSLINFQSGKFFDEIFDLAP